MIYYRRFVTSTVLAIAMTACERPTSYSEKVEISKRDELIRAARVAVSEDVELPSDEFVQLEEKADVWVVTWLVPKKSDGPDAGYVAKVTVSKPFGEVIEALVGP